MRIIDIDTPARDASSRHRRRRHARVPASDDARVDVVGARDESDASEESDESDTSSRGR